MVAAVVMVILMRLVDALRHDVTTNHGDDDAEGLVIITVNWEATSRQLGSAYEIRPQQHTQFLHWCLLLGDC